MSDNILKKILQFSILAILASFLISAPTIAATYYVDATNGNDTNDGLTSSNAWKTIAKVNSSNFQPGDFVLFKRNEIWREQLTVPNSGTEAFPICIGAYGAGEKPIISGSELVKNWKISQSPSVYTAELETEPHNVWFDRIHGNKVTSVAELNASFEWYWDSNLLYIYSPSEPTATYKNPGIEAWHRTHGINIGANIAYTRIEDIILQHGTFGIHLHSAENVTIRNCVITQVNNGIGVTGGSHFTLLEESDISYCYYESDYADGGGISYYEGNNQNTIVRNNVVSHTDGYGIGVVSANVDGGDFYGNDFHHCGSNPSAPEPWAIEIWGDKFRIHENEIHNNNSFGIYSVGDNNEIYKNKVYDGKDHGIWIGGNNNTIYYNEVYGNNGRGIYVTEGGSGNKILNNTVFNNASWGIAIGNSTDCVVKNNIAAKNGTYEYWVHEVGMPGLVMEYNLVYHPSGGNFMYWNSNAYDFESWEASVNQNLHCINLDPLFTDEAHGDFTLRTNSPCIDKGSPIGLPFLGVAPDIGANEYSGSLPLSAPHSFRIIEP